MLSSTRLISRRPALGRIGLFLIPLAALLYFAGVNFAAAQDAAATPADAAEYDPEAVARGLLVFREGGCRACHGWSGNGEREGENAEAPSIRGTLLPAEAIRLTVQCGRPGKLMPYYDHQAYNLDDRCYGITRFNVGDIQLPPKGRTGFTAEELDDLVVYLMARVVGLSDEPTMEECMLYFDDQASCDAIFTAR